MMTLHHRRLSTFSLLFPLLLFVAFTGHSTTASENEDTTEGTCSWADHADGACLLEHPYQNTPVPPLPTVDNQHVAVEFGTSQQVEGPKADDTLKRLELVQQYMYKEVLAKGSSLSAIGKHCELKHELCAFWATLGECDANPSYMKTNCAPACFSCDALVFESRCPLPDNLDESNVWQANSLNQMFEGIIHNTKLTSQVLSRPSTLEKDDAPWVVIVEDFLTSEECDTLIQLGSDRGYERSADVGAKKFDGTYDSHISSGRTSSNTWCLDECYNHTTTKTILEKIETLTGVPDSNHEYLQLLEYQVGQFYQQHHDYIDFHNQREQGVRILTVFLYLNDVEEGGGTNFPKLDLTVEAKKGRALVWPSVKNSDPTVKDPRTDHQALPVINGVKYGANSWLHLRDFKAPFSRSCI